MFGNNYGLELTVTITGNRYDRFTVFGLDFLGVTAVTGITAIITGNRILRHYKIYCVNVNYGIQYEFRSFLFNSFAK